jgi:O-antigen ligase
MIFVNPKFQRLEIRPSIYKSYIFGNVAAMIVCIVRAFITSISIENGQWIFNPKVIRDTEHDFLTSSVMGGNYFFGEDFSFFHHPTYAGIFIVFAQYLAFEIFNDSTQTSRTRKLMVFCYLFFLGALFLLSSKAAIATSILVSFWILIRIKIRTPVKVIVVAAFALVSVLFVFFNPRLKVFKDTLKTKDLIDPNARYGYDLRILSWDASLTLIKDHWLLGVGEAKKKTELGEVYKRKQYVVPAEKLHNSHNLYFDFMIGGGVIALGLFLAGIVHSFINARNQHNVTLFVFLLIFCFNGLFENLLSRQSGVLFFAAFIALLVSRETQSEVQSTKE